MRVIKRAAYILRFYSVELRIGDSSETGTGQVQLTKNPVAGISGAASTDPEFAYILDPKLNGRYLTLQKVSNNYLSITEVYITKMA